MSHATWDKVASWLESQGVTKRDFARAADVGYITVLQILNGKSKPSAKTAAKLQAGIDKLTAVDRVLLADNGPYKLTFFHGRRVYLENTETGVHGLFWPGIDRTITGMRDTRGNATIMNATELLIHLGLQKYKRSLPGVSLRLSSVKGILDPITAADILPRVKPGSNTISWISVPVAVLTQVCAQYEE